MESFLIRTERRTRATKLHDNRHFSESCSTHVAIVCCGPGSHRLCPLHTSLCVEPRTGRVRMVAHRVHAEWLQKPSVYDCLIRHSFCTGPNGGASHDAWSSVACNQKQRRMTSSVRPPSSVASVFPPKSNVFRKRPLTCSGMRRVTHPLRTAEIRHVIRAASSRPSDAFVWT